MPSDLADHIAAMRVIDTHSHMEGDYAWEGPNAPDILSDLFGWYCSADLIIAGATPEAVDRLTDSADSDLERRFAGVADAWAATQFTGYGEAVLIAARDLYGMDDFRPASLESGQHRLWELQRSGGCMQLLRDRANLDHVQTDRWLDAIDLPRSSAEFFLRDLSIVSFVKGGFADPYIEEITGVAISDLATLGEAMETLFTRFGPTSIAVKTQHAYDRTLSWRKRTDADVEHAIRTLLGTGNDDETARTEASLCVGDWCLARGVELAIAHNLPIKIHTGYLAGTASTGSYMPIDRLRAAHLAPLLMEYPEAHFVLMHIAYPYSEELIALAKHFGNVYVDLCWAWAVNPMATKDFVRRFLHTVPVTRLFGFGDDTGTPASAYAYAVQMRRWLTRALEEEIADGLMTQRQAMETATRLLRDNQEACFDIEGRRRAIREAPSGESGHPWPFRYNITSKPPATIEWE